MRRNKLVISMVLVFSLIAVLAFSACGAPAKSTEDSTESTESSEQADVEQGKKIEDMTIVLVAPQVSHPFWVEVKRGFDAAIDEFGFDGVWMGGDDHSVEKTVEAMENALALKPDAIVACPFVPSAFDKVLDKAKEQGVVVVNIEVDSSRKDQRGIFIGPDWGELAQIQSESLYEAAGDPFKVGVVMSNLDSDEQNMQVDILEEFMKDIPDAEVVDKQEDRLDPMKAMEVLSAMIKAHPEMNAVFGTAAGGVPGFAKVIEEMGLKDEIVVIGMDDTDENIAAVKSGYVYGVMAQDIYGLGYLGGKYAVDILGGVEVPDYHKLPIQLVTMENVDTYKD